jgi:hypothetical protein
MSNQINIHDTEKELLKLLEVDAKSVRSFVHDQVPEEKRAYLLESLLYEIDLFVKRNILVKTLEKETHKKVKKCCQQCLKAHLMNKLQEIGIDSSFVRALDSGFSCETGHNGYYMDGKKLIEVSQ